VVFSPGADCTGDSSLCLLDYEGVLTGIQVDSLGSGVDAETFPRYTFDNGTQSIAIRYLPESVPRLQQGIRYRLHARLQQYFSLGAIGALQITDEAGLKLFVMNLAVSRDPRNPQPPADWTVIQSDSAVGAANRGCGVVGRPTLVTFRNGSNEVRLYQGNSATLGNFDVTVLAAEEVDYSKVNCLDYALTELSYVIARKS
jgi:hypothetical protein